LSQGNRRSGLYLRVAIRKADYEDWNCPFTCKSQGLCCALAYVLHLIAQRLRPERESLVSNRCDSGQCGRSSPTNAMAWVGKSADQEWHRTRTRLCQVENSHSALYLVIVVERFDQLV
jgi:hypothetical protein